MSRRAPEGPNIYRHPIRVETTMKSPGESRVLIRPFTEAETIWAIEQVRAKFANPNHPNLDTVRVRYLPDQLKGPFLAYVSGSKREKTGRFSNGVPVDIPGGRKHGWGDTKRAALHNLARQYGIEPSVTVLVLSELTTGIWEPERMVGEIPLTAEDKEKIWAIVRERADIVWPSKRPLNPAGW